jgi:hypothetical protein
MSGSPATIPLEYGAPAWHAATMLVEILSIMLYVLVFALFPTGRFVPTSVANQIWKTAGHSA